MKNKKCFDVGIYIAYNEGNEKEKQAKEEILKRYCKEKNYNIVKVFYDTLYSNEDCFSDNMRCFLKQFENEYYFEKLIVCDINDIATEDNSLNAIYFFLKDALCVIETINQGIIGEDVLLDSTCFINVKDKKELKQNKVYYRQGQVKYSDKRSE